MSGICQEMVDGDSRGPRKRLCFCFRVNELRRVQSLPAWERGLKLRLCWVRHHRR
jgi:hypothetical protein